MDYSKSVTWISIRNIILPESNLIQIIAYCKIPLIWCSRIGKTDLQVGKKTEVTLVISEGKIDSEWREGTFCGDSNAYLTEVWVTRLWMHSSKLMIHLRFVHFFR